MVDIIISFIIKQLIKLLLKNKENIKTIIIQKDKYVKMTDGCTNTCFD